MYIVLGLMVIVRCGLLPINIEIAVHTSVHCTAELMRADDRWLTDDVAGRLLSRKACA
jgi:hypothetical protein